MSNHSTAPTIGEATMTDHSSVDALLDREVDERIAAVLGWKMIGLESGFSFGMPPNDIRRREIPSFTVSERQFATDVIPALDERGLGEQYMIVLDGMIDSSDPTVAPFRWGWQIAKAPLSLRARAALSVLEANHG